MYLKMLSAKWQPFWAGLNMLALFSAQANNMAVDALAPYMTTSIAAMVFIM